MEAARFRDVKALFDRVVELPPAERADFLASSGALPAVRAEVERLLLQETAGAGLTDLQQGLGHAVARAAAGSPREAGRTISHYRLESKLGEGGMGEVWLTDDLALGRPAAIKLLRDDLHETLRTRLRREAEASSRLQHPCIATFLETGEEAGTTWLAMEYVDGPTLRDRLKRGGLPTDEALKVAAGLIEALVHAHTAGVLHRDVKPENVILTDDGRVKLLDFGLAKWTEEQAEQAMDESLPTATAVTTLTEHGAVAGTLGYMSPEQLRGEPVDVRTDVFAVGAVLYEMLAGRAAFPGASARQRIAAVLSVDPPPLEGPGIPAGLNDVLRRALDRDAASRYPNAPSLLADLRRVGEGVAESLASDLGRVVGLKVLPREKIDEARAVLAAREETFDALRVGRLLGCHLVLTGSVQRMGPAIRITTRLYETGTGEVVAAEKVDGRVDDLFGIQDRLAQAGELFARALEIDPDYVPALADLAMMNALRFSFTSDPAVLDVAAGYARRALERDPRHPVARAWLGYTLWRQERHEEALAEELRAAEQTPDHHMAHYFVATILMDMGRAREALPHAQRSVAVFKNWSWGWGVLAWCHLAAGQAREARWSAGRCVEVRVEPGAFAYPFAFTLLAEIQRRQGLLEEARGSALHALEEVERTDHAFRDSGRAMGLSTVGRIALNQGDVAAARAAFDQAAAQMRGRVGGIGGGQVMVQTLAGQTRAGAGPDPFDEALELFKSREGFNFSWTLIGSNEVSLSELARAAAALGRDALSVELLERAREAGLTGLLEEHP